MHHLPGEVGFCGAPLLGLYRVVEKKMESTIMENQVEKNMENEMETREYVGVIFRGCFLKQLLSLAYSSNKRMASQP